MDILPLEGGFRSLDLPKPARLPPIPSMKAKGRSDQAKQSPRQVQRRLRPDQKAELISRYQAGERAYRLAEAFRLHRDTVAQILVDAGVRRPRSLTAEQIAEGTRLYVQGWSLAKVGEYFDVDSSTVWRAFKKVGTRVRPQVGRQPRRE